MPWLERLAVLWQRQLAGSKRVVIACSALKKKYRFIQQELINHTA
jgi:gluconate kinase